MKLYLVMQAFDSKMTEITALVRTMEEASYHFEQTAQTLLTELEEMAQRYSLPFQPNLSLLHANLLCGYKEPGDDATRKEKNREKKRYIISQLSEAVRIVQHYFEDARKQFDECEKLCGQIIVNARYRGLESNTTDLYTTLENDSELGVHLANIKAAVGTANALVIFEQAKLYLEDMQKEDILNGNQSKRN